MVRETDSIEWINLRMVSEHITTTVQCSSLCPKLSKWMKERITTYQSLRDRDLRHESGETERSHTNTNETKGSKDVNHHRKSQGKSEGWMWR